VARLVTAVVGKNIQLRRRSGDQLWEQAALIKHKQVIEYQGLRFLPE
jgi:hypothetical protein